MTIKTAIQSAQDRLVAMVPLMITDVASTEVYKNRNVATQTNQPYAEVYLNNLRQVSEVNDDYFRHEAEFYIDVYLAPYGAGAEGEYTQAISREHMPDASIYLLEHRNLHYEAGQAQIAGVSADDNRVGTLTRISSEGMIGFRTPFTVVLEYHELVNEFPI